MPQNDPALAALIGSRICHDLASPLGAIANGLELLTLSGLVESAELTLLRDSLRGARASLDLARLAFGRAGGDVTTEALHGILAAHYVTKSRLTLDWRLTGSTSRARAQIIALACLAAEAALPRGGVLQVSGCPAATRITATGTGVTVDAALWEGLSGDTPLPVSDPRHVEFRLLRDCLAAQGARADHYHTADRLTLTV
ncbi:hypothetical protein RA2_02700 [Roseovarius sp. A-2]|uniref:histidine phosphotransferase family protein n=1 Tax=Roseovarius sp. A-2 TaxID=1570360 RepID=UPI0009B552A6|nr:histidine phosphotransferase family protein [Roseovarius sp. A-2]GAW35635.1 hypothetical protein RA2_02700 [Roseovarius sp. A-2]